MPVEMFLVGIGRDVCMRITARAGTGQNTANFHVDIVGQVIVDNRVALFIEFPFIETRVGRNESGWNWCSFHEYWLLLY